MLHLWPPSRYLRIFSAAPILVMPSLSCWSELHHRTVVSCSSRCCESPSTSEQYVCHGLQGAGCPSASACRRGPLRRWRRPPGSVWRSAQELEGSLPYPTAPAKAPWSGTSLLRTQPVPELQLQDCSGKSSSACECSNSQDLSVRPRPSQASSCGQSRWCSHQWMSNPPDLPEQRLTSQGGQSRHPQKRASWRQRSWCSPGGKSPWRICWCPLE